MCLFVYFVYCISLSLCYTIIKKRKGDKTNEDKQERTTRTQET